MKGDFQRFQGLEGTILVPFFIKWGICYNQRAKQLSKLLFSFLDFN